MSFTFPKSQKLKKKRDIDELFNSGKILSYSILKVKYRIIKERSDFPVLAGFSVSKKTFRKAVMRNLLKRRMREAYRLNKYSLTEKLQNLNIAAHLMFIYNSDEIATFQEIENSMKELFIVLDKVFVGDFSNMSLQNFK